jgi:hypothetical protein
MGSLGTFAALLGWGPWGHVSTVPAVLGCCGGGWRRHLWPSPRVGGASAGGGAVADPAGGRRAGHITADPTDRAQHATVEGLGGPAVSGDPGPR